MELGTPTTSRLRRTRIRRSSQNPINANFRESPFQRLSGNSGQSPFRGPKSLRKECEGLLFGASRYRQTRDPTRPATFQTVSLRHWVNSADATLKPLGASRSLRPSQARNLLPPPSLPGLRCSGSALGTPCSL